MCSLGELALVPQPGTTEAAWMECPNGTSTGVGAGAEGNRPKESDFREQILQLAGIACHEDEEKSRIELLEKLKGCNKLVLIELCRSFDIRGSTSTRKDDIVIILMEFLMEHCSGIDCADPDKVQVLACQLLQKLMKRKRKRDGPNLCGGDPSKKRKPDGTVLQTHGEEESAGKRRLKDRTNCSDFDLRGNRNVCTDNKTGQFSNGLAKPGPSEGVNGSAPEQLSNISVSKKKATHTTDHNETFCGNNLSRGDVKPRKQVLKPTKDELREAVFCILDTANFATMTFGEVVKAVEKYFGKDLFERKPLIRALIEEELFRLGEEAEKKELEEEEAMEEKARAEQAAKASAKGGRVGSDIEKENELQSGQDGKSKDAEKSDNSNTIEKGAGNGTSVKAGDNRSSHAAAESSQDGKAEVETENETNSDGFSKDGEAENVAQNENGDDGVEIFKDGKAEVDRKNENNSDGFSKDGEAGNIVQNANGCDDVEIFKDDKAETAKNCTGNTIGGSEDVKAGENEGTKDGRTEERRSGNDGNTTEKVGEPEESNTNEKGEHINCSEDGKSHEDGDNGSCENAISCGVECGKVKDTTENATTEQSQIGEDDDGKAEDAEQNVNTKVDVDSSNHGTAENGITMEDAVLMPVTKPS